LDKEIEDVLGRGVSMEDLKKKHEFDLKTLNVINNKQESQLDTFTKEYAVKKIAAIWRGKKDRNSMAILKFT